MVHEGGGGLKMSKKQSTWFMDDPKLQMRNVACIKNECKTFTHGTWKPFWKHFFNAFKLVTPFQFPIGNM